MFVFCAILKYRKIPRQPYLDEENAELGHELPEVFGKKANIKIIIKKKKKKKVKKWSKTPTNKRAQSQLAPASKEVQISLLRSLLYSKQFCSMCDSNKNTLCSWREP